VLSRSRAMHERLRAFTLISLALLVVVLTGGAGPAVNTSAPTPAGQGECEAAGGTWDRSPFRPEGYCVSDTQEKCVARGGKWQGSVGQENRVRFTGSALRAADLGRREAVHGLRPVREGLCGRDPGPYRRCAWTATSGPVRSGCAEGPVFGECQRDDDPCGCRQYVRNGKLVAPAFCAD
jgi:hypothetical protein